MPWASASLPPGGASLVESCVLFDNVEVGRHSHLRRVIVDNAALGFGVTVFLGIRLAAKGRTSLEDFERAVTAIPEVQTVQHVLGQFDYRLRITARDISDFERILRRRIMTLPGVGQVEANVMLSEERRPGPLGAM